jgi:hypothetical protein
MKKINLEWVANLPEVGEPIRQSAREVSRCYEEAARLLSEALQKHGAFERELLKHWTRDEIDLARGQVFQDLPALRKTNWPSSAIIEAEERSANWLAKGNELVEKGNLAAAEKAYDKSAFWLVRANRLRKW